MGKFFHIACDITAAWDIYIHTYKLADTCPKQPIQAIQFFAMYGFWESNP